MEPGPTGEIADYRFGSGKHKIIPDLVISNSKKSSKPAGAMSKGYSGWLQGASKASVLDNKYITKIMIIY